MINTDMRFNYVTIPTSVYTTSVPFSAHWVPPTATGQLYTSTTGQLYTSTMNRYYDLITGKKVSPSEDKINADSIRESMLELLDEVTE